MRGDLLTSRKELLRKEGALGLLILQSLALRRELLASRRAPMLRLRASPTPTTRPRTPASRAKLVVIFIEARAEGRQKRHKGRKA